MAHLILKIHDFFTIIMNSVNIINIITVKLDNKKEFLEKITPGKPR